MSVFNKRSFRLFLGQYELSNLVWLLRVAISNKFPGLCTGDWNGTLLYDTEQFMIDNDIEYRPNVPDFDQVNSQNRPLVGWRSGHKTQNTDQFANALGMVATRQFLKRQEKEYVEFHETITKVAMTLGVPRYSYEPNNVIPTYLYDAWVNVFDYPCKEGPFPSSTFDAYDFYVAFLRSHNIDPDGDIIAKLAEQLELSESVVEPDDFYFQDQTGRKYLPEDFMEAMIKTLAV